jgi:hypothetical protein
MMKAVMIVGALATATLATFACSSSSNGSADNSCFESSGASSACVSCAESKCNVSALESGCSDLIKCECPNGTYSQTAAASCMTQEQESSCQSAISTLTSCENANCASECSSTSSSGSGSSSGSSTSSSGSSSGGGTPTGTCATLAACCPKLTSSEQSSCTTVADDNVAQACTAAISGFACPDGG